MIAAVLLFLAPDFDAAQYRRWGLETMQAVERDLRVPGRPLYGEEAAPGQPPRDPAFTWGVGVMLSALNGAAIADRGYRVQLADYVEATHAYWNPAGPVGGYDVLPGPKSPDRYYDDNEWMVLALVDASRVPGSDRALGYAKDAFRFVISGSDEKLDGGIYWRESDKASKNTCSNAPASAAALSLYEVTRDSTYLATAKRLYEWTKVRLRDPEDGLYWDSISLDGHIGRAKWSYNTGLMLRDAAELYRITKEPSYADDARALQTASLRHWVTASGALADDGKFMHLLLENWLRAYREVPGTEDPRPAIARGLDFLHASVRDKSGHFGNRWDRAAPPGCYEKFALIDQASAARAFFEAARSDLR